MLLHGSVVCSFFTADSFHCTYILQVVYLSLDVCLFCFQFPATVDVATIKMFVHVFW